MDKPIKPTDLVPRSFGGVKNNFSSSLQTSGFEDGVPAIYGGDNLNYQLDATGKELDYCEKICDYINAIPINKTPIVDANNKLVYTQYDIRVYNVTETYYENDYLSGFVNGEKHIYRCKQDNVIGQPLNNETYFERVDIMGNVKTIGRNVGETILSVLPLTDAGLHLLDGALIDGSGSYAAFVTYIAGLVTDYPDLFVTEADWQSSVTTYGVCGKFVYDSTNNTVRLPKVTGIIEGTIDVTALGDLVNAGLPNITGYFDADNDYEMPSVGCFYNLWSDNYSHTTTNTGRGAFTYFDASRSNSIYGNSTTVQPQTIKGFYYIVIATSTKTDIEVDIDEIATDLNGKADTDLTNCTDVANIKMAHNAMPSDTYIDLTLGASGTTYTAPADGYVSISKIVGSDWYYLSIDLYNSNNVIIANIFADAYRTSPATVFVPVYKGQRFVVSYNATGVTNWFRFIYAQGSESEAS